jgi:hypothetical protein
MLWIALAMSLVPAPPAAPPSVRPLDHAARAIVESGHSSPTVRQLLASLDASNVVVYVRSAVNLPAAGVLTYVSHAASQTYLLVRIDLKQSARDRVATLAHELTHATEVASASPPVASAGDLAALYRRIGSRGRNRHEFESAAAQANEREARIDQDRAAVASRVRTAG